MQGDRRERRREAIVFVFAFLLAFIGLALVTWATLAFR